ncbi:MAG TPA: hypothetical protein VFL99_12920 [Segeticoccus sp.]|uniref:hypothetical protein n=1 Tax=Segeticoccus sp. TaxID=2706531 RepID=UPI002D7EA1DF|nr:hypothetical protein [Segeticoccus sp.]HET8601224.1 hypothetical protein [Segeticoccus sp.]
MTTSPPDAPSKTYRQRSSELIGWACMVIAVVLLVMTAVSWTGSHPSIVFIAWVCFGAAVAWSVMLRPCLELSQHGVLMRNVVRDVRIPWTQVDDVEQRWNVKVYTPEDRGYTAWAIAAQPDRPRRSGFGFGFGARLRDYDRQVNADQPVPEKERVTASLVAEQIRRARAEYEFGRERGLIGPVGEGEVHQGWAWWPIAAMLVTAVAVAVLTFT